MNNMSKKYILSKEDLQNLIHESITFFSDKTIDYVKKGKTIMFSDRTRWLEEFLNKFLKEIPMDTLLDEIDKTISSFTGRSLEDIKNDIRLEKSNAAREQRASKAWLKEMEEKE